MFPAVLSALGLPYSLEPDQIRLGLYGVEQVGLSIFIDKGYHVDRGPKTGTGPRTTLSPAIRASPV
jgi:hypothetical protein